MSRRAAAAIVLAAACSAWTLHAQQAPQRPVFRSRSDLVQVDVVVVDQDGNPIRGLKAENFTLLDRKKLQSIAVFDEISHEVPAATAASLPVFPPTMRMDVANNQTSAANRLVVMVVDDLHIYKGRTDVAKNLARQVILQLGPQASMAVLFTSGEHSTQVVEDRSLLLTAAETLKGRQSWRRPNPAIDSQRAPPGDPEKDSAVRHAEIAAHMQDVRIQDFFDNMSQYKTLEDASRMLGADDGRRKAFVLVTEGIGKDLHGMFEGPTPCETSQRVTPCYHDAALRKMMEAMRRSSVATYAIDPRGHLTPQELAIEAFPAPVAGGLGDDPASGGFRWNNPIRQAQDGLHLMSEASGGFAVTDTDDLTGGLRRILQDIDHYYLLGFYPSDAGGDGYRPLDVKVSGHPEWKLRFRKGYEPGGPPAPPVNKDPLVALSAGVMPNSGLPLRLWATAFPTAGKAATVAIALEITAPTGLMKESDGRLHDDVKYQLIVVDDKKARVTSRSGHEARLVLSPRSKTAAMPDTVDYQIPLTIELAPGRYQLRASATSAKLDKGGSVYLSLEVPDFSKVPLALSGLTVGFADGARVPVARPTPPTMSGTTTMAVPAGSFPMRSARPPIIAPTAARRVPFEPSLNREFVAADVMRVYFEVGRANAATPLASTIVLLDAGDRVVRMIDRPIAANERRGIDLRLPLTDVAPGAYRLRVIVSDGKNSVQQEIGIVVR